MKPFLFVLSVLCAYCIGMFVAKNTQAETPVRAITAPAPVHHHSIAAHAPVAMRAHARPQTATRQRRRSARPQHHAPAISDYVVFAGTDRYRELESTCEAYPGRCVRVGNTTIIQ